MGLSHKREEIQPAREANPPGTAAAGPEPGEFGGKAQLQGLQAGQMAVSCMETSKRIIPDIELLVLDRALGVTTDWLLGQE